MRTPNLTTMLIAVTKASSYCGGKRAKELALNERRRHAGACVADTEKDFSLTRSAGGNRKLTHGSRHGLNSIQNQILNHLFHALSINQGQQRIGQFCFDLLYA